jgi:putative membrane protein
MGLSSFSLNLIVDQITKKLILREDPVYNFRRMIALSLFSWALWLFFIILGVVFAISFAPIWWIKLILFGSSAVVTFRMIVLHSTSSDNFSNLLFSSLLQPISGLVPFLILWTRLNYNVTVNMYLFLILSAIVGVLSSSFFIYQINRMGNQKLGIPSLYFLKAFLLNWIVGLNDPFENLLEKLGETKDVDVWLIKFSSSSTISFIVIPDIHPGPFKNVGSSLLPSMIKSSLEMNVDGLACVPHGLLGHELDLTSQKQNYKIINQIIKHANMKTSEVYATSLVKTSSGPATACCQIIGKAAFFSFTLAPNTTEDLSNEIGFHAQKEAEKYGFSQCPVVNAHNSIDGEVPAEAALSAMKAAATDCMKKASLLKRKSFEIGAKSVKPKEFTLKDGMGQGGITVIVIKVGEHKTAYVTIDGNNMVSGLREKIISSIQTTGLDAAEIFTTDTHSVSALILDNRGYHPIGDAIDHERLISYIREATISAISDLKPAKTTTRKITISNVKVIGANKLETLCLLVERTIQKAKKITVPIFTVNGLVLIFLSIIL